MGLVSLPKGSATGVEDGVQNTFVRQKCVCFVLSLLPLSFVHIMGDWVMLN